MDWGSIFLVSQSMSQTFWHCHNEEILTASETLWHTLWHQKYGSLMFLLIVWLDWLSRVTQGLLAKGSESQLSKNAIYTTCFMNKHPKYEQLKHCVIKTKTNHVAVLQTLSITFRFLRKVSLVRMSNILLWPKYFAHLTDFYRWLLPIYAACYRHRPLEPEKKPSPTAPKLWLRLRSRY